MLHSFLSAPELTSAVLPKVERCGREVRITLAKWVGTATGGRERGGQSVRVGKSSSWVN